MKISLYVWLHIKTIPWKFRNLKPVTFEFFLKSRLLFNIFYCFCMFVNKHFIYLECIISKIKQCYNAKPSAYYFYVKKKILVDFHTCISVPLSDYKFFYLTSTSKSIQAIHYFFLFSHVKKLNSIPFSEKKSCLWKYYTFFKKKVQIIRNI